jgi:Tfp pilus assembly protein PilN
VKAPLNLARQPFRNERLPTLVIGLGTLALAVATARQARVAWELMPGHARDVESEVGSLEREAARLRADSMGLRDLTAPEATVREWAAVKGLVDRRVFSWTGLFAALEQALPPGVRLVSVSPSVSGSGSGTELQLSAIGRSNDDALALLQSLQAHADFEGAFLNGWSEAREGITISCTVSYVPGAKR